MALVRIDQQLRRDPSPLQSGEEFEALVDGDAVIQLTVRDQGGRAEVLDELVRRPLVVQLRVVPGIAFELPLREPHLFGHAVHRLEVVDAGVRHQGAETIGVAEDPVDHVAAEGAAGSADAATVDEGHRGQGIHAVHDVVVRLAAPVSGDFLHEFLPVPVRATGIRHEDYVPARGEDLRVPAIGPRVSPSSLRSAMDQDDGRVFLRRIEHRRLHDQRLHFAARGAGVPDV